MITARVKVRSKRIDHVLVSIPGESKKVKRLANKTIATSSIFKI